MGHAAKLPDVELNHVNGQMAVCSDERRELVTQRIALPLTFVLLEGQLIADPTLEEVMHVAER
jgi:exosome complex RNA-binding protein Rrp42 (RNase PH superfamily)